MKSDQTECNFLTKNLPVSFILYVAKRGVGTQDAMMAMKQPEAAQHNSPIAPPFNLISKLCAKPVTTWWLRAAIQYQTKVVRPKTLVLPSKLRYSMKKTNTAPHRLMSQKIAYAFGCPGW